MRTRRPAALAALLLLALAACTPGAADPPDAAASDGTGPTNVVVVLTDDLAMNLVQYMPAVQQLARDGTTFSQYTVTDSLCCPSRASILTGRFPHSTGVFTNSGDDGGVETFRAKGNETATFATALKAKGYRTALMGKYLNGYQPTTEKGGSQASPVPPGWTEWDVAGAGYKNFDYDLNENGRVVHHGSAPADYLTDVVSAKGSGFITAAAKAKAPFLLEIATFAPHSPYTPAPADEKSFPGLRAPRTAAYDTLPAAAPAWLADRPALTPKQQRKMDADFRSRAQAVQSISRMLTSLRATLGKAGVADRTMVVFTSDNGFHMGEHRLTSGKQTAFDTDVHVPLIVAGAGVPAGRTVDRPVQNIDLAPTFEALGGVTAPATVEGRSLLPLLRGEGVDGWRTAALIEHHGPNAAKDDPDAQDRGSGTPTTYAAMRTATATYVEYADGGREYYDRRTDPDQLRNTASTLPTATAAKLHAALAALVACRGGASCWAAGHPAL